MTNIATEASVATVTEVQVSGLKNFEGHRWREAILHYLNGMWGEDQSVTYRPKIHLETNHEQFASLSLCFDPEAKTYYVQGTQINPGQVPATGPRETIIVDNRRAEVEQGLIRFVKDDRIRLFTMFIRPTGMFCLWKTEKRSQLCVSATRVRA